MVQHTEFHLKCCLPPAPGAAITVTKALLALVQNPMAAVKSSVRFFFSLYTSAVLNQIHKRTKNVHGHPVTVLTHLPTLFKFYGPNLLTGMCAIYAE